MAGVIFDTVCFASADDIYFVALICFSYHRQTGSQINEFHWVLSQSPRFFFAPGILGFPKIFFLSLFIFQQVHIV